MTSPSSEVKRSKRRGAFEGVVGVGLAILAVVLFVNKVNAAWPAACLGAAILIYAIGTPVVSTECPQCGAPISRVPDSLRYLDCAKCGSLLWNRRRENRIELMEEGFVAEAPEFQWVLPWNGFALPGVVELSGVFGGEMLKTIDAKTLDAKWPAGCCVCGEAADHEEVLAKRFSVTPGAGLVRSPLSSEVTVRVEHIPHCPKHAGGAALSACRNEYGESNGCLVFCSARYFRLFKKLNKSGRAS